MKKYRWHQHLGFWLLVPGMLVCATLFIATDANCWSFLVIPGVCLMWMIATRKLRAELRNYNTAARAEILRQEQQQKDREEARRQAIATQKEWVKIAEEFGCPDLRNAFHRVMVWYLSATGELRLADDVHKYLTLIRSLDVRDIPMCCLIRATTTIGDMFVLGWHQNPPLWTIANWDKERWVVKLRDFAFPRSLEIKLMITGSDFTPSAVTEVLKFATKYTSVANATLSFLGEKGARVLSSHSCSSEELGGLRVALQLGEKIFGEEHYFGDRDFNLYHLLGDHDPGRPT